MNSQSDQPAQTPSQAPSLSIDEAARRLGVSTSTIRRQIKRGEIPATLVTTARGPAYRITLPNFAQPDQGAYPAPTVSVDSQLGQGDHDRLGELIRVIDRLTVENREMAGRVGYLMRETEELREENRRLLAASASGGWTPSTVNHSTTAPDATPRVSTGFSGILSRLFRRPSVSPVTE